MSIRGGFLVYRQTPRSARIRATSRRRILAAARRLFGGDLRHVIGLLWSGATRLSARCPATDLALPDPVTDQTILSAEQAGNRQGF